MGNQAPPFPDPDDWWATPAARVGVSPREPEEDWASADAQEEVTPQPRLGDGITPRTRLLVVVAVGVLVLLVLGLAVAGVFSSSTPKPAPTTAPQQTTTAAHTTTTTPVKPKPAPVAGPTVTLNPGASGPQTKSLQQALVRLGHDPGPVDGSYGPLTAKGVEEFQRAAGLAPDGIFGPKTLAALLTALKQG